MKPFFILLAVLLGTASLCQAQRENHVWAFGDSTGLDFNSGTPVFIKTAAASFEGCASISDSRGQLLFYCNQQKIWDRNHHIMPNGSGILGEDVSTTMGTVIAPFIDDTNMYYVFTITSMVLPSRVKYLRYSVVDRRLNGGLGDVVPGQKNIILDTGMSEKMILAQSDDCFSLWLLTHHTVKSQFYAYKITTAGISAPVVSAVGCQTPVTDAYGYGNMDISADFSLIAHMYKVLYTPIGYTGVVAALELYDFDKGSGKVSNCRVIDSDTSVRSDLYRLYWSTLSPGKTKLYCGGTGESILLQYDLSLLPSLGAVKASKINLPASAISFTRGPDNKLYFPSHLAPRYIGRIDFPELPGLACSPDTSLGLRFTKLFYCASMNNNTVMPLRTVSYRKSVDTSLCLSGPLNLAGPAGYDSYAWSDGSSTSAVTFTEPGVKWVYAYRGTCELLIDTFIVRQVKSDTVFYSKDTQVCFSSSYEAIAPEGYHVYAWNDGIATRSRVVTTSGTYWVYSISKDCRVRVDTFRVKLTDFGSGLPETDSVCGKAIRLRVTTTGADCLWFDGSTDPVITVSTPGYYWVRISRDGCILNDTVQVVDKHFTVGLGDDVSACEGSSVELKASMRYDARYLWQDGTEGPVYKVTGNGIYSVVATAGNCISTDTVQVDFVRCRNCISLPNSFTPNQDQLNDRFGPMLYCNTASYSFDIYNRFGQRIFHSSDPGTRWDGNALGRNCDVGVYFYLIRVRFDYPGAEEELWKGDVTLLR